MSRHRKHIPLLAQLHAALRQLGFEPHEVELDHDPALGLRPLNKDGTDTVPPANDPKYLVWRPKAEHRAKTTGRRGESKLSISGNGDQSRIAKVERLAPQHEEFRRRVLGPVKETKPEPKYRWPARKLRSGNGFRRDA